MSDRLCEGKREKKRGLGEVKKERDIERESRKRGRFNEGFVDHSCCHEWRPLTSLTKQELFPIQGFYNS